MLKDKITAIVLAAGQGTRMKSARPKVLHEILGRPMLAYLIETLKAVGVDDIVLVVGHQAEQVQDAYKDYGMRFVVQEPQLGTGHAVQVAMAAVPAGAKTVMVLCGDAPLIAGESILALQRLHKNTRAAITIQSIILPDGAHYGRVVRMAEENRNLRSGQKPPAAEIARGQVVGIVQAKDAKGRADLLAIREINTGAYCFEASFLAENLPRLEPSPVTGEIYLTDLIQMAREQGRGVEALIDPDRDNLLGINSRAELAAATQTVKRAINAAHMDQGVTLIDPESVYIEPGVRIGRDTVIYPNVYLQGNTVIGENCIIESTVKIVDSTLADGVHIKMGCVLTGSRLGAGADMGPFAHLRPGADLRQKVHVGNFVEVKKSVLHEGVKAGHLTYLGDADVGAGTNVGAGTITCNYDGEKKHPTTIGEGAFIGSNTALVAPVTVGAGAYIGAGSTITEDVPPGKLGIARARQEIKERRFGGELIKFKIDDDAFFSRIILTKYWNGDPLKARFLLEKVLEKWPLKAKVNFMVTCGGFLQFEWPNSLGNQMIGNNKEPNLKGLNILVNKAKQLVQSFIDPQLRNNLLKVTDYLTIGIDSYKDKISMTKETISMPHIELVFLIDLRNDDKIYWTGKSYPTSGQEKGLVRISDLNTHFINLQGVGKTMILGCHDLTIFNPRSRNAKGWRKKINRNFIELAKNEQPDIVLHHPHTTVKTRTWLNAWNRMNKILPSVSKFIGAGRFYEADRKKSEWDNMIEVLEKTKNGKSIDVIIK